MIFLDTNIIIRFLRNDHPQLSQRAREIFTEIEKQQLSIYIADIVIAEVIYILDRIYKLNRPESVRGIKSILALPNIKTERKPLYDQIFNLYLSSSMDFEDACQVALMNHQNIKEIYSFDRHFDKISGIKRLS